MQFKVETPAMLFIWALSNDLKRVLRANCVGAHSLFATFVHKLSSGRRWRVYVVECKS